MNALIVTAESHQLIRAIRLGYRAAGLLPEGNEWVGWLKAAYYDEDQAAVVELLGHLADELADVEGAWDLWVALRHATWAVPARA